MNFDLISTPTKAFPHGFESSIPGAAGVLLAPGISNPALRSRFDAI